MAEFGQVRLICYEVKPDGQNQSFSYCTGFSTANRSEVTVHVSRDKGIFEGTIFTFNVKSRRQDGVLFPDDDSIHVEEDDMGLVSIGTNSRGSIITKMSAHIVFSSLMEDREHCAWSREFGKIFIPESFHVVLDAVYKVDVVRDWSRRANEVQALFSICEGEVPKKLDVNVKSQSYLQDVEDELRTREKRMRQEEAERRLLAEPIGQMGFASTSTPSQAWQNGRGGRKNSNYSNQPFSRRNARTRRNRNHSSRDDDELMKSVANNERMFVIARIFPSGWGEAWNLRCRSITLNYLRLDDRETRVSVGDWCSGVIRYNPKKKEVNSGFFVEKILNVEDKALCTRVDSSGVLQMELELYFDPDKTRIMVPTPECRFYAVKHEKVGFVLVRPPVFEQHYERKVHGILDYRDTECVTLSNWVFAKFVRYLGEHETVEVEEQPDFGVSENFSEQSENFSELMGGHSVSFDAVSDEGVKPVFSYSSTNRTRFTDQPTGSNLARPTPFRQQTTSAIENDPARRAPPNSPIRDMCRFSVPNRLADGGHSSNRSHYEASGSGMEIRNQPNLGVECVAVVTEYLREYDCAILYCTREEQGSTGDPCLMRSVKATGVRRGDWLKLRARRLPAKSDSTLCCIWEAIAGTVERTEELNPMKITPDNCVQMDTLLHFSYMVDHPLAVWSLDVGYTFCNETVEQEDSSRPFSIRKHAEKVNQSVRMGRTVPKYRGWIQYIYNAARKQYDWHLVAIRGSDKDVTAYDERVKQENIGGMEAEDEDEIAMQKEKARARMEMENGVSL